MVHGSFLGPSLEPLLTSTLSDKSYPRIYRVSQEGLLLCRQSHQGNFRATGTVSLLFEKRISSNRDGIG
jgi:hypothetical protein